MLRFLLINLFFCSIFYGMDCKKRLFDIHIKESLSIEEALDELASYCTFSIVVKDELAKNELGKMQKSLYISQMTLEEIFKLLLKENNLNYEFNGKILSIWGISTQIFKLSYITSVREGQSIIKASVDSKPRQNENDLSDESNDNMIKSMEKFDFWQNIEKEITALLEAYGEVKMPIINANAGIIIVTGTPIQLKKIGEYITKLENRLKTTNDY